MGTVLTSDQASPDTEALPMSLRVCTQGVGGGREGGRKEEEAITAYLSFSCGFLFFWRSYQSPSSGVV